MSLWYCYELFEKHKDNFQLPDIYTKHMTGRNLALSQKRRCY